MNLPSLDAIDREIARRSLYSFLVQAWPHIEPGTPFVDGWHIKVMCDKVQALIQGRSEKRNLILNVPPGSMKSTIVSVATPAWEWLTAAEMTYLFVSGSERVALRDSAKCRNLINSEWYQGFGLKWKFAPDQNAKGWFKNTAGGERQAIPAGSAITGQRVHRIFMDDPNDAKDINDAKLLQVSDGWFLATQNRLKDMTKGTRLLIQQRTHMRDLTGEILEKDGDAWDHVVIRQEYELDDPKAIPEDPRTEPGQLLFPARFPVSVVESEKRTLGPVGYAGQHQQRPVPKEGATFKPHLIEIIDAAPAGMTLCRGWDPASSQGKGDWTVGALLGATVDGYFVIVDIVRARTGEPRRLCKLTATLDGDSVPISWPQDPGQAGKDQVQSMLRDFAGYSFRTSPETGAKETRWEPFSVQVNGGRVKMVRASWNRALVDEMTMAPRGAHDDQLDALARAFKEIGHGADPWLSSIEMPTKEDIKALIAEEMRPQELKLPRESPLDNLTKEEEMPDWM